jgi:hypothetical protein
MTATVGPLVDAAQLARELSVSRDFIYEHAAELGALRLGAGPKARLRFDPIAARAALADASASAEPERSPRQPRRTTGRPRAGTILPIRDRPRRRRASIA